MADDGHFGSTGNIKYQIHLRYMFGWQMDVSSLKNVVEILQMLSRWQHKFSAETAVTTRPFIYPRNILLIDILVKYRISWVFCPNISSTFPVLMIIVQYTWIILQNLHISILPVFIPMTWWDNENKILNQIQIVLVKQHSHSHTQVPTYLTYNKYTPIGHLLESQAQHNVLLPALVLREHYVTTLNRPSSGIFPLLCAKTGHPAMCQWLAGPVCEQWRWCMANHDTTLCIMHHI